MYDMEHVKSIKNQVSIELNPTIHHSYHLNDVLNKRGFEAAHIAFWLLKDYAWIRVWDYRLIATIGFFATAWGLVIFIWDVYDIFKPKNSSRSVRYEIIKECFTSLGCVLWLAGNSWWAIGENWDLAHTAGYNDVYEAYTETARIILTIAACILIPFWASNFSIEVFGLSKTAYQNRLMRQSKHLFMTGKSIPFAQVQYSQIASVEASDNHSSSLEFEREEFCLNNEDTYKDYVVQMDICGMPYKTPGVVGVPSGMPHFKNGMIKEKKSFACQAQGVISYRDYENIIIMFWLCKDLIWLFEDPMWAQISWYIPATLVSIVSVDMFATLLRYRRACQILFIDCVHSFALVLWIACNLMWGWGEMYMDDTVPGMNCLDEDMGECLNQETAFHYIIPGLFTSYDDLPPGPWFLRFIAGWFLLIALIALFSSYVVMLIIDLNTWREEKRAKRTHRTIPSE